MTTVSDLTVLVIDKYLWNNTKTCAKWSYIV